MSRHNFPTDKAERTALICLNLSLWIPKGTPKRGKQKPVKDDIEEAEGNGDE